MNAPLTTFKEFISPIYELLIENNFKMLSTDPEAAAGTTRRITVEKIIYYNDDKQVKPQHLRDLANQIKATRGRPRFIKGIQISHQIMKV